MSDNGTREQVEKKTALVKSGLKTLKPEDLAEAFMNLHGAYAVMVGKVMALEAAIIKGSSRGQMLDHLRMVKTAAELDVDAVYRKLREKVEEKVDASAIGC